MLALALAMTLAADGGAPPRTISVTLGGTLAEVKGEAWPTRRGQPADSHEFKGPLDAVVRLPSGREYRVTTTSMTVNTFANDRARVRSIYLDLGTAPTWPEIVERSQQPLRELGVSEERRLDWKQRLLAKPVPFPNYPVEACVTVGTTMREKGRVGFYLSLELTLIEPPCAE